MLTRERKERLSGPLQSQVSTLIRKDVEQADHFLARSAHAVEIAHGREKETPLSYGGLWQSIFRIKWSILIRIGYPARTMHLSLAFAHKKAVLVICWIGMATCANADFKDGRGYWFSANFAAAIQEWQPLAQQGDAVAQCYLGLVYTSDDRFLLLEGLEPRNTAVDQTLARGFFLQAKNRLSPPAEAGDRYAQFCLGLMSIVPDLRMGLAVLDAEQFPPNTEISEKWLVASATQGLAEAQCALAMVYESQKPEESLKWMFSAAEQDYPDCVWFANMHYSFSPSLTADEGREMLKWIRRGAELGFKNAQEMLGDLYESGNPSGDYSIIVEKNLVASYFWYRLAGSPEAETVASHMIPADKKRAEELLMKWKPKVPAAAQH